ncbi:hypothetical protein C2869_18410 [Saccharobesus litoralis]|uniref:Uncharacterized protein n=1 Tax=Saccharobesus litoralis TaxID=2172099 RepID=A0A2S0VVL4_9ALTE|nr:hypothetical protein [Saccharobesus litoralis]AWB68264.1 hypothetical protein C2869_18410 [Saccharobesus litoralis]
MKTKILFFVLLLCSNVAVTAKPLSEQDLQTWMQVAPQLQATFEKHQARLAHYDLDFDKGQAEALGQKAKGILQKEGLLNEFTSALQGKMTVDEFFVLQIRVTRAIKEVTQAMAAGAIPNDLQRNIAENIVDLEKTQGLTAQQKAMLRKQMESLFAATQKQAQVKPLSADGQLVKKHLSTIQAKLAKQP